MGLGSFDVNGQVWRVTASGAVPVLGKATPATMVRFPTGGTAFRVTPTNPVQDIPAGRPVPADSISIGRIDAVVPLDMNRFVAVVTAAVTPAALASLEWASDSNGPVWQQHRRPIVLVVDGGRVVRLEAPDLAWDVDPVLSRLDGSRALLSVDWRGLPRGQRAFVRIDAVAHQLTRVGQGPGKWVARTDGRVEVVTHPDGKLDRVSLSETALP